MRAVKQNRVSACGPNNQGCLPAHASPATLVPVCFLGLCSMVKNCLDLSSVQRRFAHRWDSVARNTSTSPALLIFLFSFCETTSWPWVQSAKTSVLQSVPQSDNAAMPWTHSALPLQCFPAPTSFRKTKVYLTLWFHFQGFRDDPGWVSITVHPQKHLALDAHGTFCSLPLLSMRWRPQLVRFPWFCSKMMRTFHNLTETWLQILNPLSQWLTKRRVVIL